MQPRDVVNGRFEIDRLAGAGGMGTVYRAIDRTTGSPVAVKVISGSSGDLVERFIREAAVLAELQHPGIVRFVASGTTPEGQAYLVMEWLEGESLGDRLARGNLSVPEAIDLGCRVASALSAAHARGVVHRDLKPGNIFLVGRDLARVKVLDFGIARIAKTGVSLTRTGQTMGSPGYTAPEQARGERNLDARADVFSLACLLFKCTTGDPPFTGDLLQVLVKVVMEPAPLLSSRRDDVPPALEDLLQRMLAKPPEARPADGAAVAAELAAIGARIGRADSRSPASMGALAALPPAGAPWSSGAAPAGASFSMGAPLSMGAPPSMTQPDPMGAPPSMTQPDSMGGSATAASAPWGTAPFALVASASPRGPSLVPPPPPRARARSRSRVLLVALAVAGVLAAAGAGVMIFVVPALKDPPERATAPVRTAPTGAPSATPALSATGAPAAALACGGAIKCVPFSPTDPFHVDLMEVLPSAMQLAQSVDRGASFCEMSMVGAVDGTVSLGADPRNQAQMGVAMVRFTTGKARGVDVAVMPGHLFANEGTCVHPAPVPACSPRAAAHVAAVSGVPRGTPAVMMYRQDEASGGPVWELVVNGRPELTRRIDGRTCTLKYKPR